VGGSHEASCVGHPLLRFRGCEGDDLAISGVEVGGLLGLPGSSQRGHVHLGGEVWSISWNSCIDSITSSSVLPMNVCWQLTVNEGSNGGQPFRPMCSVQHRVMTPFVSGSIVLHASEYCHIVRPKYHRNHATYPQ